MNQFTRLFVTVLLLSYSTAAPNKIKIQDAGGNYQIGAGIYDITGPAAEGN